MHLIKKTFNEAEILCRQALMAFADHSLRRLRMLSKKGMLARILLSTLILLLVIGAHMAANAMEITLAWDLNKPSENVSYYRIYWDKNKFTNETKPSKDKGSIEVHLTDLENYEDYPNFKVDANTGIYSLCLEDLKEGEVYYLAVQALSDKGESRISNLVNTQGNTTPDNGNGGGGNSGSGCFILTIQ